MPKGKGNRLNPKSPLTETEQRGIQVRVTREVDANDAFHQSIAGGSVASPKSVLKKAARRDITAAASRQGVQRMLETRRDALAPIDDPPNGWDWDTDEEHRQAGERLTRHLADAKRIKADPTLQSPEDQDVIANAIAGMERDLKSWSASRERRRYFQTRGVIPSD